MLKLPVNTEIEKQYLQIISDYNKLNFYKKNIIDKTIFNITKVIKQSILNITISAITDDKKLIENDEKIYDYYKSLIKYYKNAMKIYDSNKSKFVSDKVIKILNGLYDVIFSLINQFDDAEKLVVKNKKNQNPIYIEKRKIIEENTKFLFNDIDKIGNNYIINYDYDINSEFENELYQNIILNIAKELYDIYIEYANKFVVKINDIENREVAGFYYELLKEEKTDLQSVIKIQIDVLEKERQSEEEKKIVQSILSNLREGYQYLNKNINELEQLFKFTNSKSIIKICEFKDFKIYIVESFDLKKISCNKKTDYIDKNNEFKNSSFNFICNYVKYIVNENLQDIDNIKDSIENVLKLTNKLIDVFFDLVNYSDINKDKFVNVEFNDIILGINESIKIKTESLKENKECIQKEFDILLNNYKSETINISDEELKDIYDYFFNNLSNDSNIELYITDYFREKIKRKKSKQIDIVYKKIMQFKREQILFEISTFEEILNYSVSRLRNSQNDIIKEYVDYVDKLVENIKLILNDYGIKTICPNQHDIFNGKEHEVIIAEKNDDFKRGEIIKVMNNGYKQDDVVILRANVIAAK